MMMFFMMLGSNLSRAWGAPPAPPTGLMGVPGNNRATIMWNASAGATRYTLWRGINFNNWSVVNSDISGNSYVDGGLTNGTTYSYTVSARNGDGTSAFPAGIEVTPTPLLPPTNFQGVGGDGKVTLSWTASANANFYRVWGKTGNTPYVEIGSTTGTSYVDSGLTNGLVYDYAVSSNYGSDTSAYIGASGYAYTSAMPQAPPVLSSLSLSPSAIYGGNSSIGTITLDKSAPANLIVTLSDGGSTITNLPASVTVAAGSSTAQFTVTTQNTVATANIPITATYANVTKTATLTVNPSPVLSTLSVTSSVVGGNNATGTVTLTQPALGGGAVVSLSDGGHTATGIPANVTVAAGATSATFAITTNGVSAPTTVTITASYGGVSKTADITVQLASLYTFIASPTTLESGATSTGTLTLTGKAPSGGLAVALASDSNGVLVPTSVTIPAGAGSATFTMTAAAVSSGCSTAVTATLNGVSRSVTLTVRAAALQSLTLNPTSVVNGNPSTGTVTLTGKAPAAGVVVALAAGDSRASVPATVTVASGNTQATFTVTTTPSTNGGSTTISATYNGVTKTANLTCLPPVLSDFTISPTTIGGGNTTRGTVTLTGRAPTGGLNVTLTSSNPTVVPVSSPVWVKPGQASEGFPIPTTAVSTQTTVTLTATYAGVSKTATLTVIPEAPAVLSTLTLNPTSVVGGQANSTGTITLDKATTAAATITLSSNNTNAATVPATVTIAAGAGSATFAITSKAVTAATNVTITATYNGVSKTATLTVTPPTATPQLVSLTISPTSVVGGNQATGTVTLNQNATSAVTITLTSSDSAANPGSTITIGAGFNSETFAITTSAVTARKTITITATLNGVSKTATLTVNPSGPLALDSITLSPTSVVGGKIAKGKVTLTQAASAGGITVSLQSLNTALASLSSPTITIPAGQATSAEFDITTVAVSSATPVTIRASYNGVQKEAVLNITSAFEIVNVNDGDILRGYVKVVANIYDINMPDLELYIDGQLFANFVTQIGGNWVTYIPTDSFNNSSHTLQAVSNGNSSKLYNVIFQNDVWNIQCDSIFDITPHNDNVPSVVNIRAEVPSNSSWTVNILNDSYSVVKTFTGSSSTINLTWDGTWEQNNNKGPDGIYMVSIKLDGSNANAKNIQNRNYASSPDPFFQRFINQNRIIDSLVVINTNVIQEGPKAAIEWAKFIRGRINLKVGIDLANQSLPFIILDGVDNSKIVARVKAQLAVPLKLIYTESHGYGDPSFLVGGYGFFPYNHAAVQSKPSVNTDVSAIVRPLGYGNIIDPPKLLWIDACDTAGHARNNIEAPVGSPPVVDDISWATCFGIDPMNGFGGVFLGIVGFGYTYLEGDEWALWRQEVWNQLFIYNRNFQTSYNIAGSSVPNSGGYYETQRPRHRFRWWGNEYESF